jgi:hypothetical protein
VSASTQITSNDACPVSTGIVVVTSSSGALYSEAMSASSASVVRGVIVRCLIAFTDILIVETNINSSGNNNNYAN